MMAASWASPLIVNDRVYISNEDGTVYCFRLAAEMEMLSKNEMDSAVYTTPIVANDTLFIANRNGVYSLREGAQATSNESIDESIPNSVSN
jgi:outer membrane protein assembly factor BamB